MTTIRLDLRDLRSLKWATAPTLAQIREAAVEGMRRYQDFLQCTIGFSKNGVTCYADDVTRYGAQSTDWVIWYQQHNAIVFNNKMTNGRHWTLTGITKAVTHELGHKYLWPFHVDHWPELNGGSHVMKAGAGSDYYGTFSPWEIYYFLQKGWKLNSRPVHPFARTYSANTNTKWRAANLPKLKMIVRSYGAYHAKLYAWQDNTAANYVEYLPLAADNFSLSNCIGCVL